MTVEDSLKTEEGGSVIFMFIASGSRVYINENTELGITALLTTEERPLVDRVTFSTGKIYSIIKNTAQYELKTSYCFILVKSVEIISQCDKEKTTVTALRNTVEITNDFGNVTLEEKHTTTVFNNEARSKPLPIPENEIHNKLLWFK